MYICFCNIVKQIMELYGYMATCHHIFQPQITSRKLNHAKPMHRKDFELSHMSILQQMQKP